MQYLVLVSLWIWWWQQTESIKEYWQLEILLWYKHFSCSFRDLCLTWGHFLERLINQVLILKTYITCLNSSQLLENLKIRYSSNTIRARFNFKILHSNIIIWKKNQKVWPKIIHKMKTQGRMWVSQNKIRFKKKSFLKTSI